MHLIALSREKATKRKGRALEIASCIVDVRWLPITVKGRLGAQIEKLGLYPQGNAQLMAFATVAAVLRPNSWAIWAVGIL